MNKLTKQFYPWTIKYTCGGQKPAEYDRYYNNNRSLLNTHPYGGNLFAVGGNAGKTDPPKKTYTPIDFSKLKSPTQRLEEDMGMYLNKGIMVADKTAVVMPNVMSTAQKPTAVSYMLVRVHEKDSPTKDLSEELEDMTIVGMCEMRDDLL